MVNIYNQTSHLPTRQPCPCAPCARCVPTALFCSTKELCAPPGHRAITFKRLYLESDMIWMSMKLYYLMYLGDKLMTKGSAWLTVDWNTPDLSPISLWKVPLSKNPGLVRTWMCGGIGCDQRVSLWNCVSSKLNIYSITVLGNLNHNVSHSSVSARIFTRSRNTLSSKRTSKSSKSAMTQLVTFTIDLVMYRVKWTLSGY